MNYKTDLEIAREYKMKNVKSIAKKLGISSDNLTCYGDYMAKIDTVCADSLPQNGKLILVTAITPTKAGEGKTTMTIGLADAIAKEKKRTCVCLREPSLGPVFGVKGGAAGGGYSQVVPMENINLHFTGDIHAVGAANNLLAAMLDNHIMQGNALNIDLNNITWKRCLDMNDRQLRFITDGQGGGKNGVERKDGFDITVASEIMAILCLASDIADLKARLARIVVAYNTSGEPVTCGDLKAQGAMTALLVEAIKPNLVQTLGGTPAIVHGGPFANIAHGCNSVIATRFALKKADYVVTEAGFGADLGAEKFFDIKCRTAGLTPSACVVVATVRALKMHGGAPLDALKTPDIVALEKGLPNLFRHVSNVTNVYKVPCVVAINKFTTDSKAELDLIIKKCAEQGVKAVVADVWGKGGSGAKTLAREVIAATEKENNFEFCYPADLPIKEKIEAVVTRVYHGAGVSYTEQADRAILAAEKNGFGKLPVCIAKTQYSFSDDMAKICAPDDFTVTVRNVKVSAGAGFVVVYLGDILTMPGLPLHPAAENIDVDEKGNIYGLF